jgi:hypothetical protein
MTKLDLGLTSARDYLDQQVAPAHARYRDVPSRENAIKTAAALWDTVGWLWSDLNPGLDRKNAGAQAGAFDKSLFQKCPALVLIRDLADAAKHGGELSRSSVVVTAISGSGSPGGTSYISSPLGTLQSTPACTLRIECKDGTSSDMTEVLHTAHAFLRREVP